MIIDNNDNIQKIDQSILNNKIEDSDEKKNIPPQKTQVDKNDRLELSSNAMTLRKLTEKTQQLPEIREDKVNQIKQSIQDGTYEISSQKIADKIIDEGLGLLE